MRDIQIGIPCGYNSEHYVNFLLDSIRKTISDIDRTQVLLGQSKPEINIQFIVDSNPDFNIEVVQAFSSDIGSLGHGKCLDVMLKHMSLEYGMVVDCDVAFLEKNWDIMMIDEIRDDNVIIGAGTEKHGDKYYNFPFSIMALFKTDVLKEVEVSFMPAVENGTLPLIWITLSEEDAHIFGRNVGDKIKLDTAWQLPWKLKSNGYTGTTLPLLSPRNGDEDVQFLAPDLRGDEHHMHGTPLFTHKGRSQDRSFNHDVNVVNWKNRVKQWLSA
jgi:hypothetical protein